MNIQLKRNLLCYGIISGVCFSYFFLVPYVGISMPIYAILQFAMIYFITKDKKEVKNKNALWMFVPIFILTLNYFISASDIFNGFNLIVIFILYSTMMLMMVEKLNICEKQLVFVKNIFENLFKPLENFHIPFVWVFEGTLKSNFDKKHTEFVGKIVLGLLISIPLVFIMGNLMASSDLVFENIFYNFWNYFEFDLDIDLFDFIFDTIIAFLSGLYLFGLLYAVFKKNKPINKNIGALNSVIFIKNDAPNHSMAQSLDDTSLLHVTSTDDLPSHNADSQGSNLETKSSDVTVMLVVYTSVLILYTMFVSIQFRYLFAGATLPLGFTYAEYARRGFFELLMLSFINIGMIVSTIGFAKSRIYEKDNRSSKLLKIYMGYLCLITVILLISSYFRMNLYNAEYGLTRLRILVVIFLVFEAIGLGFTFFYITKPKFNIIAIYAVVCLSFYSFINLINIDYFIAKNNIDLFLNEGKDLDRYYLSSLSEDAASQIARLKSEDTNKESYEESDLVDYYDFSSYFKRAEVKKEKSDRNWHSFNLSRFLAQKYH